MHESVTYQAILDEGTVRTLLKLGRKKFGEPSESQRRTLLAMDESGLLDRLVERVLDVDSWDEFLRTP